MAYNEFQSFLVLSPSASEEQFPYIPLKQDTPTIDPQLKIKRRQIIHPSLKQRTKKNGNMPKSIIGNFYKYIQKYENLYSSHQNYEETKKTLKQWHKRRIDLGLQHLNMLFKGQSRLKLQNCRVMREILSNEGLEIIGENTKVMNNLSYFICFEKYIYRLTNPEISGRIQSR